MTRYRKIERLLLLLAVSACMLPLGAPLHVAAQGIPFFRNYLPDEYHGNSINFDIESDNEGNVYVANFEGLMYYDHAQWRMLRTPDNTRIIITVKTSDGTIWVGGYNFFGKVARKDNGELCLKRVAKPDLFNGEVREIYERNGKVRFVTSDGYIFQIESDNNITIFKNLGKDKMKIGMVDGIDVDAAERGDDIITLENILVEEPLSNGFKAVVKKSGGLIIANEKGEALYTLTAANGLCSDDITYITYDGQGTLWGATSKGLFAMKVPSAYSHFSTHEGLQGSVLSIEKIGDRFYVGTDERLFRQNGLRFEPVAGINHACWAMTKSGTGLLAATAEGVYRIAADGSLKQLSTYNTLSVLDAGSHYYSGELDGVYQTAADGSNRKKVSPMQNVTKILRDERGVIRYLSLTENKHTIVDIGGRVETIAANATTPFPYPFFSYTDDKGTCWLTNEQGKALYGWKDGHRLDHVNMLLKAFDDLTIRAVYTQGDELWIGSNNGLTVINTRMADPYLNLKPDLRIRSITLNSDSILWGGFGQQPEALPDLEHQDHNISFRFSLSNTPITGKNLYRFRLNDGSWSSWSTNTEASFVNLAHGDYTFSVQAKDAINRTSDIVTIAFHISPPFYLRWYMNLVYIALIIAILFLLFQLRLRRLEKDNQRLELIIKERTAEVVRLEKMATAGKLTQGLIDRILNPLNYINNFSKLSQGLIKDVKANIEDDKDHMDQENYDDTMDVLDMLTVNLQKVSEHGQNTTRTLKAMEEMLKDRSGGKVAMDLETVIHQDEEMLKEYYKQHIAQYGIKTTFDYGDSHLPIVGNADLLSKTIMSLLGNAVYAVVKKAQKLQDGQQGAAAYTPEVALRAAIEGKDIQISIRDNGIGIGPTIINKVFDPFFTTKTTSEAAGVGLYLSHEIIQDHGGTITVDSVKGEYTMFTIIIPVKKT